MALEAGAVFVRAGARVDARGFEEYQRRLKTARGESTRPIEAHARMRVDERGYEENKRRTASARAEAKKDVVVEGKMDPDQRGFRRYEEHIARARGSSIRFGTTLAGVGLGSRAALVGVQGAAVGAGAALAGIVFVGARFEQKMNAVKAVTRANKDQMKALSDQALQLGASTGLGASKAADAIIELAKGGLDPATISAGGLKGALGLASAGGLELADAAAATANALNLFGLNGRSATHIADAFATAANATTADVSDFALALSQGGGAAKAAGLSFDQTTVALEALAANGVKGSDAGTSLKSALTQIAAPTKQSAAEMKRLNLHFFDAHGNMKNLSSISSLLRDRLGGMTRQQRLQVVQTIAGTDGMRALLALYDTGPRRLDGFSRGLKAHGTAARVAREQQAGLAGAGRRLLGALESLGIRLSRSINPALTKAANAAAGFFRELSKGEKARGTLGAVIRTLHDVARIVGPVIKIALDAVRRTFSSVFKGIAQTVSGVVKIFRGFGNIIAGVFTLDFGRAFRGLRQVVSGGMRTIIGVVRTLTAPFRAAVSAVFSGISSVAKKSWDGVGRIVRGAIRFITGGVSSLLGILADVADAASNLPIVGGKFKGIARDIRGAQRAIDNYRDSLKDSHTTTGRVIKRMQEQQDHVVALRARLGSLRKGTREYRDTARDLRAAQGRLNTTIRNASPAARRAASSVSGLASAVHAASGTTSDSSEAIAKNLNQLAHDLGAKGIKFRVAKTPAARRHQAIVFGGASPELDLTAPVGRAQGGYIGRPGARGADTVRLNLPNGAAVLTRHQLAALGLHGRSGLGASSLRTGLPHGAGTRPIVAGAGELVAMPHELPMLNRIARLKGFRRGMRDVFNTVKRPHYMASGGMVHVPGDPNDTGGRDRVNPSIVERVSAWVRRYHANVGYAFDPGGGHHSPGHNVTGTATDVYPGPGGNWDLLERGLAALVHAGYKVLYDGRVGTTPWPGHGRGNHAHIEWGSSKGGVAPAELPDLTVQGPDGILKRIVQAAVNKETDAGNAYLSRIAGAIGGDAGAGGASAAQARAWIVAGLRLAGVPATPATVAALMGRAKQESGWNPRAQNNWDSNAAAGHPSKGFLQTIDSTFNAHNVAGHDNIWNPVDNVAAAVRYMLATYGHIVGPGGGGYQSGGFVGGTTAQSGAAPLDTETALHDEEFSSPAHTELAGVQSDPHPTGDPKKLLKLATRIGGQFGRELTKASDLSDDYSYWDRKFGLVEEDLVDEATGTVNQKALAVRTGELRQLLKIRRQVLSHYRKAVALAKRAIVNYRRMIARARGLMRRTSGKTKSSKGKRKTYAGWIKGWQGKVREWRGRVKELGGSTRDAELDVEEAKIALNALAPGAAQEAADARSSLAGGDTTDTTDGTDTATSTDPVAVATAALASFEAFNTERSDLFNTFGANFMRPRDVGVESYGPAVVGAGERYFGGGRGGVSPSAAGGFVSGAGGSTIEHMEVNFTGPQPFNPHTSAQTLGWELEAALG